ncbi:MAG: hypothetical protein Phog2KO_38770 [Phototrophicaceae bacterium]
MLLILDTQTQDKILIRGIIKKVYFTHANFLKNIYYEDKLRENNIALRISYV